ncbi:MAG: hypothetical protein Solivirus1_2 [Solivirus sp.]|uniref:Uncharacterized protein n=1 Tax=Solivirus sp. TaxID=2487772 RepID=A0A3G5AF54_9VIRU|nr:MAG: hypothetical protein Solivirus1_2 [Solivirus sp.]
MNYPSQNQLRYVQTVLPTLPPDLIVKVLVETDHPTFKNLCQAPEFQSFCSSNSVFSERIYEERSKKVFHEFIDLKSNEMSWRQFYDKLSYIFDTIKEVEVLASDGDMNAGDIITDLSNRGDLMTLKILHRLNYFTPEDFDVDSAIAGEDLDRLKWFVEVNPSLLNFIINYNLYGTSIENRRRITEWLDSIDR